jgi:rhamnogalacturonan endolyase
VTLSTTYGYTKSKHYQGSNYGRTIDYDYVGKATSSVGIWLIRSNHEKASGGPFFRSLLRGCTTIAEDLYEILYYNMGTTDPERFGLQGPYVLSFTDGSAPNSGLFARKADWSWMDGLGITGWVASSARGYVVSLLSFPFEQVIREPTPLRSVWRLLVSQSQALNTCLRAAILL